VTVPRALIAEAIDLVVFIKGRGSERRVDSILELAGLDEDEGYVLKPAAAPALHVV
jgi:Flp pilus assembly CpaF family ATPase